MMSTWPDVDQTKPECALRKNKLLRISEFHNSSRHTRPELLCQPAPRPGHFSEEQKLTGRLEKIQTNKI